MQTTYIVIAAIAGFVLGILSNWLYDILNRAGVLPSTQTLKRFIGFPVFGGVSHRARRDWSQGATQKLILSVIPVAMAPWRHHLIPKGRFIVILILALPLLVVTILPDLTNTAQEPVVPKNAGLADTDSSVPAAMSTAIVDSHYKKIAMDCRYDANRDIYTMNASGENLENITNNPSDNWHSAWSPDGQQIAFTSSRAGNYEIYLMEADGSNQRPLTNDSIDDWAFEIYSMDLGSFATINLTNSPGEDFPAKRSPDSRKIVFSSHRAGNSEIYLMNFDGSSILNLTNNPADDREPAWSPDGKKLVFVSDRDGRYSVYTMNIDGTNIFRISDGRAECRWPSWQP